MEQVWRRYTAQSFCDAYHLYRVAYALEKYGPRYYGPTDMVVRKVAIVDFDIHHGNGTEEIIRTSLNQYSDISDVNV